MVRTAEAHNISDVDSWQELFERSCSDRVKKAIRRAVRTPEICLEHARAEMAVYEEYENEPRIIQRARVLEKYLQDKRVSILDDELIVGNVTSKIRGSAIVGELYADFLEEELDDPEKDFEIRGYDRHVVSPEERKELNEVILPYFKGKTLQNHLYAVADEDVKEKGFVMTSSCPHIPNFADLLVQQDAGHMLANYEKVLHIGFTGLKEEVESYRSRLDAAYMQYGIQDKKDFYDAALITLEAAIDYARRYSDLAQEMAAEEIDPKRRKELEQIAEVCRQVPAKPARNWWEALQSVWMTQVIILCEQINYADSFGRFDQYMHPFYKSSVVDNQDLTREEALELLECFWVKTAEFTELYNYDTVKMQAGFSISQNLLIGGQTKEGKDACNEVTMLCLEAEEQVGLIQPEIAFRMWEGTPEEYLKKAAAVVRLGRGKPKFYSDRTAIEMMKKAYPDLAIEDWRNYAVIGCVELALPHISHQHSFTGLTNLAKIVELTVHNGRCTLCGKQIGPMTGDPRSFESIEGFKQAFREQNFYWMKHLARSIKVEMDVQAELMKLPFSSSLLEGPLQKGKDLIEGGAWYTAYGVLVGGVANAADSFSVIDDLIYRKKAITWDQLIKATAANWEGYDELRRRCVNEAPKYGNDDDYADSWAAYVMDIWYDSIDWVNKQNELLPPFGGSYRGAILIGNGAVGMGTQVGGLPDGRAFPMPLADTLSPVQGRDINGPTAVIKSVSKLPAHRFEMGTALNQRLNPELVATDRDLDNFVAFLRTIEALGVYHIQFNIINSRALRKAMSEPDNYRDLMVRVASYVSYFVELDEMTQLDIINRTEQQGW